MSRKRPLADGPRWAVDRQMRAEAEMLLEADDATITARAHELGADPLRLKAFVDEARRRRAAAP